MALTRSFKETVKARADRDPAFRRGLLQEAIQAMLENDVAFGKTLLRDYINATIGYEKLAKGVKLPPKSLSRMFSAKGNPGINSMFSIIAYLQSQEGVTVQARVK